MSDEAIELRFALAVFSIDCLKRAAYRFSGVATFDFDIDGDAAVLRVAPIADLPTGRQPFSVDDFKREVLDADLRANIASDTEAFRNTILSHVFSKTGLVEHE